MDHPKTIIRVRRGINGSKYSACDYEGNFLRNFNKLADVRSWWKADIHWGNVVFIRELDKEPDMSKINDTIKSIQSILENNKKRKAKRRKISNERKKQKQNLVQT